MALSFCTASKAKISFTPFKIGQYFSPKDPIPKESSSWVAYKFSCMGCNTQHIGETTVYYNTRQEQHFYKKTGVSAVYKHLHEGSRCTVEKNLDSSFSIIDRGSTRFALNIKEALLSFSVFENCLDVPSFSYRISNSSNQKGTNFILSLCL